MVMLPVLVCLYVCLSCVVLVSSLLFHTRLPGLRGLFYFTPRSLIYSLLPQQQHKRCPSGVFRRRIFVDKKYRLRFMYTENICIMTNQTPGINRIFAEMVHICIKSRIHEKYEVPVCLIPKIRLVLVQRYKAKTCFSYLLLY